MARFAIKESADGVWRRRKILLAKLKVREYGDTRPTHPKRRWPAYIAKVGSKFYPIESVTEQLITRVGQLLGVRIADSQLRIIGPQVRFMSKYFLAHDRESLVHGLELFREHLDPDMVDEIAATKSEKEFYTFKTVYDAMQDAFPNHVEPLMGGFVEMLAFDAIVGNNDRHPANWGIISHISKGVAPVFSPVFDTARSLFWNNTEARIAQMLASQESLDSYIHGSTPQIGWEGEGGDSIDHYGLISRVYQDYPEFRPNLERFRPIEPMDRSCRMIDEEFATLMSPIRRKLIAECLRQRHQKYCDSTT